MPSSFEEFLVDQQRLDDVSNGHEDRSQGLCIRCRTLVLAWRMMETPISSLGGGKKTHPKTGDIFF